MPDLVWGQIAGGAWMGPVPAPDETTLPFDPEPDHAAKEFSDYLMAGPHELPETDCVVLEHPSSNGLYSAEDVGEMSATTAIPAIVSAIHDAIGSGSTSCRSPRSSSCGALDAAAATPARPVD